MMNNNRYKILVVEDESNILSFVKAILEANEYQVVTAKTCENGIMMFGSHLPDLVILDLGLPDGEGTKIIEHIRKKDATPIVVLSARLTEQNKVKALDLGANDYITKPFSTAELLARVRVALRNRRANEAGSIPGAKFQVADLVVDYDRRLVTVAERPIKLTQTEYNILAYMTQHAGKVLTYATIVTEIWGYSDSGSIKKLQVNMANLRKKLGTKPGDNRYIVNELGVGYRMSVDK